MRNRWRVLVIDDDVRFTDAFTERLERTGRYEARTVGVARKSVTVARAFEPDLILLNPLMPDMDGSIVAAALRMERVLEHTPIAFLAPGVSEEILGDDGELGGLPVIPKPFGPRALVDQVERMLGGEPGGTEHGDRDHAADAAPPSRGPRRHRVLGQPRRRPERAERAPDV